MSAAAGGPLAGVRVLDLGRYVAAPYCAMLLGDLGAEVIRVERPGGDEDRRLGLLAANQDSFTFTSLARGKLGVTLDLRRVDEARGVLADLVSRSDVLVHNFGPEAARAFRIAYEDVRALRPDLVYAAISGFGPGSRRLGFDPVAQMVSGAASLTGCPEGSPLRAGVPWADYSTGLAAALGVLAALRHRDLTGEGQAVDCSLLQTAVSFTAPAVAEAVAAGRPRPRLGNQPAYIAPSNLYRCRDGCVYLAAATTGMWRALAALIDCPELGSDPGLRTAAGRFEQRERVDAAVQAWASGQTVSAAVAALEAAGVPCGPQLDTAEVPSEPHVRRGSMLGEVDLGLEGLERVPVSASPVRLSGGRRASAHRPPPRPGEHNRQVYCGLLGYGPDRLAELRSSGLV